MSVRNILTRSLLLACVSAGTVISTSASAQVRIQNSFRTDQQINIETGPPASSQTQPGWWSAEWAVEPVDGTEFVRFKNKWKGTYLNNESGNLDATAIQPGWWSAQWSLTKVGQGYRICNRWKATCLHTENGKLELGNAPMNWASAVWNLNGYSALGAAQAAAIKPFLPAGPFQQCVSNVFGTGIVATVKWYRPNEVTYIPGDPRGDNVNTKDVNEAMPSLKFGEDGRTTPYKEENIALGQKSCVSGNSPAENPSLAIVSVTGGKYAAGAVSATANTLVALAGIAACAPTFGAGCAATAAALASLGSGTLSVGMIGLPDAQEVFYAGVPGQLEVKGTVFSPVSNDIKPIDSRTSLVRQEDATDKIKAAFVGKEITRGARGIRFVNKAGYAASMVVTYFQNQQIGPNMIPMPKAIETEKVTAGFERTVEIPYDLSPGTKINVIINGVATIHTPLSTVVEADFTGEKCFKSTGTIFDASGGAC
jgi:hypothetical protein